ncbi:MAG TPA: tetratricopeptide repeat protein [Fibrobacteraceae bacterium]|nr:tetratricopeptide repeat protein [Fibrobacteraceae bacterium]
MSIRIPSIRLWWQEILLAVASLLAVICSSVLVFSSFHLHLLDMQWQLKLDEYLEGDLAQAYLLSRFADQYNLYQGKLSARELDEREYRFQTLLDKNQSNSIQVYPQNWTNRLGTYVINALRHATGKAHLASPEEMQSLVLLERAFQYERNRDYANALQTYAQVDSDVRENPRIMGLIGLHQGVSLAMLGSLDSARTAFHEVIQQHPSDDLGQTAKALLDYMEGLIQERAVVLKSGFDPLTRARKMSALLQCRELLSSPERPTDSAGQMEMMMLRARCEEELGHVSAAVRDYGGVIRLAGQNELARDANRRLYVLGGRIREGRRLQKAAMQINQALQDSSLQTMQDLQSSLPDAQPSLPKEVSLSANEETVRALEEEAQVIAQRPIAIYKPIPDHPLIRIPKTPEGSQVTVKLYGGKTFIGRTLKECGKQELCLQTMIGVIHVPHREIAGMEIQN